MSAVIEQQVRAIVHRTRGQKHGPITRLVSPGDLGHFLKPFVFLDLFESKPNSGSQGFAMHPHSGIATVTLMIQGDTRYEDTTGKEGVLLEGGVEWMRAGNGVWHTGSGIGNGAMQGFQLWIALPASEENAPAQSVYLAPTEVQTVGPARVLLGHHETARSTIPAPPGLTYLAVDLKAGERWRFTPAVDQTVAWLAVNKGQIEAGETAQAGELIIFEESNGDIDITAASDTSFVLGSAVKHPHDLVMGHYSVHTTEEALVQGEAEIRRIGTLLRSQGRL